MSMKEGKRVWGTHQERKQYGRYGRKRWRGNLIKKLGGWNRAS